MNNKQSSVEWLFHEFISCSLKVSDIFKLLEQAKAMHKEEMDKVAGDFWNEGASYMHDGQRKYNSFDDYYKEKFGGNNED